MVFRWYTHCSSMVLVLEYNIVLVLYWGCYSAILLTDNYCRAQILSVLFCSVLFCSVLFCFDLFWFVHVCYPVMCYVVLFCSALFCSALYRNRGLRTRLYQQTEATRDFGQHRHVRDWQSFAITHAHTVTHKLSSLFSLLSSLFSHLLFPPLISCPVLSVHLASFYLTLLHLI